MATIKVFSANGVKELKCFDTLEAVPYDEDEEEIIEDDGELTVGLPLHDDGNPDNESNLVRQGY